jgi:hypothetical protein
LEPAKSIRKAFDPSEARDEHGRWTSGAEAKRASSQRWFHGTDKQFDRLDPKDTFGVHLGTAEQANYRVGTMEGGRVIPVRVDVENTLRLPDHVWDTPRTLADGLKAYDDGSLERAAKDWENLKSQKVDLDKPVAEYRADYRALRNATWDAKEKAQVLGRGALLRAGYDSVVYRNQVEGNGDSLIVLDPTKIKSGFAKALASVITKFDEAQHPRDDHGRWTSGGEDPSREDVSADPAYLYHATTVENVYDIVDEGKLDVHRPDYGTDQSEWPDGSRMKRSYWTHDPNVARSFYPEGKPALVRTLRTNADFQRESTSDQYLENPISSSKLEIYSGQGKWRKLT